MTRAPLWTLGEIAHALGIACAADLADTAVGGISIDSRTLAPGDLFIALVGENSDGHAHVAAALAKGAAGALAHRPFDDPRVLHVADTLAGLTALGAAGRARFGGRLVAVSGSVGKTTTKEMLRTILAASGPTHAADASYNNHWGVPLTLARMPRDAAFAVIEIGMNHPGEIIPLATLARPDVAVLTTVASAHIGHMGSLEAIAREKASLYAALGADGIAIVPADAPHRDILLAGAAHAQAWLVGDADGARARFTRLRGGADGSEFAALIDGTPVAAHLHAPGGHMARNALLALAAAAALGANVVAGAAALSSFRPGAGRGAWRLLALPEGGRAVLLDESYNASSASMRAAFEVLAAVPARRRLAVLGDMRELGSFATAEHLGLAEPLTRAADLLWCCGEHMGALFDAVPQAMRGAHTPDARTLAPLLCTELRDGDAVLVKGSFGSRMRDVVAALDALAAHSHAEGVG